MTPDAEYEVSICVLPEPGKLTVPASRQLQILMARSRRLLIQTISASWVLSEQSLPLPDRYWHQLFGQDLPSHKIQVMAFYYRRTQRWRKPVFESKAVIVLFVNLGALRDSKYESWVRFLGSFLLFNVERAKIDSGAGVEWLMLAIYSTYKSLILRTRL